jgi:hypothetical protein
MRKLAIVPALAAFIVLAAPAAADMRSHTGFDSIKAEDDIEISVSLGETYAVEVTGADAGRVLTSVDDRQLRIRQRNRPWFGSTQNLDAQVRVVLPRLEGLAAARAAVIRADSINATEMNLAAAMAGEIHISGECDTLDVAVAMGGVVDARNFHCATADIAASMGGEADVHVADSYDVAGSMGAAVTVSGQGQQGDVALSMGAELNTD